MMEQKRGFLKVYLILAIILAVVSIIDGILTWLKFENRIYGFILLAVAGLFFLFNIVAIPIFHHQRLKKIAYVLPIYYIVSYIIFFGVGVYLFFRPYQPFWLNPVVMVINYLMALFEIVFSVYLWRKLMP